jgi:uncharacterized membrane protein
MDEYTNGSERFWAGMSYVCSLFAPIFGPLLIYVFGRPTSRFVAFHALQSLFIELVLEGVPILLGFLGWLISFTPLGCFSFVLWIAGSVLFLWGIFCRISGAIAGFGGVWRELPLVGPWARGLV